MKIAGFLLLASGWIIAAAAITALRPAPVQTGFVLAALAIEVPGLVLTVRSHMPPGRKRT